MRGAVTATGQYQAITLAAAQMSAPTTLCRGNGRPVFLTQYRRIQLSCWEMATRVPPKPQSITLVFAPKVQQHQARVFSIARRQP